MILIENGTLVSPRESFPGDILVEGEKIKKIFRKDSPNFQAEKDAALASENTVERIEAGGKLIFPGFIDCHTHFELHVAGTVTCDDFP